MLRDAGLQLPGPVAYATDLTNFILSAETEKVNTEPKAEKRILYIDKNNSQNKKNNPSVQYANNILRSDYSKNLSQSAATVKNKFEDTVFALKLGFACSDHVCGQEKGNIADIANASALTRTSETSVGTASSDSSIYSAKLDVKLSVRNTNAPVFYGRMANVVTVFDLHQNI